MGAEQSTFAGYDMAELEACTFFSKPEIIHIHKRFAALAKKFNKGPDRTLTADEILTLNELHFNPFGRRICQVFSEDGSGSLAFEHFLDMLSIFSPDADDEVKFNYIFRIFDFDNDGYLDFNDVLEIMRHLTGELLATPEGLTLEQMREFTVHVLKEADLDGDQRLSPLEFEHLTSRIPDFFARFRFRV